jgi:hypothetical protein
MSANIQDFKPHNEWVYRDEPSLIEVFRAWCKKRHCAKCPAKPSKGMEGACFLSWQHLPAEDSALKERGIV